MDYSYTYCNLFFVSFLQKFELTLHCYSFSEGIPSPAILSLLTRKASILIAIHNQHFIAIFVCLSHI